MFMYFLCSEMLIILAFLDTLVFNISQNDLQLGMDVVYEKLKWMYSCACYIIIFPKFSPLHCVIPLII